jgi:hypothetical protein
MKGSTGWDSVPEQAGWVFSRSKKWDLGAVGGTGGQKSFSRGSRVFGCIFKFRPPRADNLDRVTHKGPEKRRRARVPVRLEVKVRLEGQEISVVSRNLSLKGLACSPHPLLKECACCQLVISLAADTQVSIKGRVVRLAESEVGIDFLAMDPESFGHLKKIVEYHSQRPEALAAELLNPAFSLSRPRTAFKGPGRRR